MNVISQLSELVGTYCGLGLNHEQQEFNGNLSIKSILEGKGIELEFLANGADGTCFHAEKTIVTTDFSGNVKMWNLNSNSPGMTELELRSTDDGVVFGIGELDNGNSFREEVKIELLPEGVGYHYSWGMPGGDFAYRSGLVMRKSLLS